MRIISNILFLIFILSLLSCNPKTKTTGKAVKTYSIALNGSPSSDFYSQIDTAYFIVPETNDSSIIGEIGQAIVSDKLILTDRKTNKVLQFAPNGRHLSTCEAIGNGPGEYVRIDGLFLHRTENKILILDASRNKVLTYDSDFNFIEERPTPVPFGAVSFSMADDHTFVFEESIGAVQSALKYCLFIQDTKGKTQSFLPFEQTASVHFSPRQSLYHVNDTLVFVPTYNDTLYNVFSDKVEPRFRIDFGEQWVDKDFVYAPNWGKDPMLFMQKLADQKFIYFFNLLENRTHIYMDFYYKGEPYASIFDKRKEENTWVKFDTPDAQMKPLTAHGDYYVFPVARTEFAKIAGNNSYQFKGKDAMADIDSRLNEESNPILMFIKFK